MRRPATNDALSTAFKDKAVFNLKTSAWTESIAQFFKPVYDYGFTFLF